VIIAEAKIRTQPISFAGTSEGKSRGRDPGGKENRREEEGRGEDASRHAKPAITSKCGTDTEAKDQGRED